MITVDAVCAIVGNGCGHCPRQRPGAAREQGRLSVTGLRSYRCANDVSGLSDTGHSDECVR
jgi:hypothetical protein